MTAESGNPTTQEHKKAAELHVYKTRIIETANRWLRGGLQDMHHRLLVAPQGGFFSEIFHHGQINQEKAAKFLVDDITQALQNHQEDGEFVVIDDNTHAVVYGMRLLPQNSPRDALQLQVIAVDRFTKGEVQEKVITHPELRARFILDKKRGERALRLTIRGSSQNGEVVGAEEIQKKGHEDEKNGAGKSDLQVKIKSMGNNNPRSFFIATSDELILVKADQRGTIHCSYEYEGGASWFVSGKHSHKNRQ